MCGPDSPVASPSLPAHDPARIVFGTDAALELGDATELAARTEIEEAPAPGVTPAELRLHEERRERTALDPASGSEPGEEFISEIDAEMSTQDLPVARSGHECEPLLPAGEQLPQRVNWNGLAPPVAAPLRIDLVKGLEEPLRVFELHAEARAKESPALLPPRAALLFDQAVDIQSPDSTLVQAGGVVEVSVNGAIGPTPGTMARANNTAGDPAKPSVRSSSPTSVFVWGSGNQRVPIT